MLCIIKTSDWGYKCCSAYCAYSEKVRRNPISKDFPVEKTTENLGDHAIIVIGIQ